MNTGIKMKIGERGQVVIPKKYRDRFGLLPNSEAEFVVNKGWLLLRPVIAPVAKQNDNWDEAWGMLRHMITDVDSDIEEMRGR